MPEFMIDQERLQNQTKLFLRVNYITSVGAILFGLICLFLLHITEIIPFALFAFGVLNLANLVLFAKHKKIMATYGISSVLALIASFVVTLYSGGIQSSFIFMIALVAFGGYATNRKFGVLYLNITFVLILLVFSQSFTDVKVTKNVVPEATAYIFDALSVLFAVFLLGNIFGKNLLRTHHALYNSKISMTNQMLEKENLLKEVHHRVKNNLQTVSSLLSLQSRTINDGPLKALLKGTQNRVIAMAMVHEMLYMREDLSHIEYKSYVLELSEYLIRSIKGIDNHVNLIIDIPNVQLGIDTAIPLGLLINEALTNALKYGIKDDNEGEIHISLQKESDGQYTLRIGDNGTGFPETINYKNTKSLGLKLIHNLTRQLRGTIERDNSKKGTNYIVKFQEIEQQLSPVA